MRSGRLAVIFGSFCRTAPAAALRGLAKVRSGFLPAATSAQVLLLDRGVHRLEAGLGHVNLATHLEAGRQAAATRRHDQALRDVRDLADVFGHVLAPAPVAAGRRLRQPPVLVDQRHRQAVDLGFRHQREVITLGQLRRPAVPVAQPRLVEDVAQAQQPLPVLDHGERRQRTRPHLLRGRVGRDQRGVRVLQRPQLLQQGVPGRVADLGIVQHVVAVAVIPNLVAQLFHAVARVEMLGPVARRVRLHAPHYICQHICGPHDRRRRGPLVA